MRVLLPFLACLILLTAVVRTPLLDLPLERDEGEYAYIAWRLDHGELPYRDWVDQKPPGVFWTYRAALHLPLQPVRAIHAMAMLFSAASACALFLIARRFMVDPWAGAAAALFVFLSADPWIQGTAANTEIFMLTPMLFSQLAFLRSLSRRRGAAGGGQAWMLLSGVLTGVAVAFKQVAAVNGLFLIAAFPAFTSRPGRWRASARFAALSTLGAGAVWAMIALYFARAHALGDLAYCVLTHNLEYVQAVSWAARAQACAATLERLAPAQGTTWLLGAAAVVAWGRQHRWNTLLFVAGGTAAGLVGVSASGYYFPHYFQQVLGGIALAAGGGAQAFVEALAGRISTAVRTALAALLLFLSPTVSLSPFVFSYTRADTMRAIYPGNAFTEMVDLGASLAQLTRPEDRVFVFGAEPELLFYARRISATRYIFLFPLYGPYGDAKARQEATAAEIVRSRPAAAVYMANNLFFLPGTEQFFTRWTQSYLQDWFTPRAHVAIDGRSVARIRPTRDGQAQPTGASERTIGVLLVRKDLARPDAAPPRHGTAPGR